MPTSPEAPCSGSCYANVTAQEAARKFLGRHRLIVAGAAVALIACAACVASQEPGIEGLAAFMIDALLISLASTVLNRCNFSKLLGIMSIDCDARKMLDAASLLMEKRRKPKEAPTYELVYAMCSAQLGCDDVALQWVDKAESEQKLGLSNRLLACNVRAVVAGHRGDRDELANVRGQVAALRSEMRASGALRRTADLVASWIDFDLALGDGDWQRCSELLGSMQVLSATRQQKVSTEHRRGMLAEARGDMGAARDRYAFVAANGGTCRMARQSAEWLAMHKIRSEAGRSAGRLCEDTPSIVL